MVHIQAPGLGIGQKLFHLVIKSRGKDIEYHDYKHKLIDSFKLIVVNPPKQLNDQE